MDLPGVAPIGECTLCRKSVTAPDGWRLAEPAGAVHWDCFAKWPKRKRFAAETVEAAARSADPETAVAHRSPHALLLLRRPFLRSGDSLLLYLDSSEVLVCQDPEDWTAWIVQLEQDARSSHPFRQVSLLKAVEELKKHFPTADAVREAVDWSARPTICAVCEQKLGVDPGSDEAFRLGHVAPWPSTQPLGAYSGRPVHSACLLSWKQRAAFHKALAELEGRLARLTARGCAHADARVQILLEKELNWRDAQVRLLATGTLLLVRPRRWKEWLDGAHRPELRPFEQEALDAVLPDLRARFPDGEALAAVVDWPAREKDRLACRAALAEEGRRLEREGRCPACSGTFELLPGPLLHCAGCGAERSPIEFGWLPDVLIK